MAFGIAGSESSTGGEFLKGRLQFDSRVGFFKTVNRTQESDGMWVNLESEPFKDPVFLCDFGSLEVGYARIANPPTFIYVPYGQPIPPQPSDLNDEKKKAFQPSFRVKILAPKLFGDTDPRHFGSNAKTVMGSFEQLWNEFSMAPEAHAGQIPVVAVLSCTAIEVKTPQGKSKFFAPVFTIQGWKNRPEVFGERTVPAPAITAHTPTPTPRPVANHAPPPAPKAAPAPAASMDDDEMPF